MHNVLLAFVFALALLVDLTNGYYEKEKNVLGEDPYAYVLGPTEMTSLKALNRYQIEQGLMKRELDITSLFVRGTV
jgi:hypothetical protein